MKAGRHDWSPADLEFLNVLTDVVFELPADIRTLLQLLLQLLFALLARPPQSQLALFRLLCLGSAVGRRGSELALVVVAGRQPSNVDLVVKVCDWVVAIVLGLVTDQPVWRDFSLLRLLKQVRWQGSQLRGCQLSVLGYWVHHAWGVLIEAMFLSLVVCFGYLFVLPDLAPSLGKWNIVKGGEHHVWLPHHILSGIIWRWLLIKVTQLNSQWFNLRSRLNWANAWDWRFQLSGLVGLVDANHLLQKVFVAIWKVDLVNV